MRWSSRLTSSSAARDVGVLVVRRDAVVLDKPSAPGGGTVSFVSPSGHDYLADLAAQEAGTPNAIGDIRTALAGIAWSVPHRWRPGSTCAHSRCAATHWPAGAQTRGSRCWGARWMNTCRSSRSGCATAKGNWSITSLSPASLAIVSAFRHAAVVPARGLMLFSPICRISTNSTLRAIYQCDPLRRGTGQAGVCAGQFPPRLASVCGVCPSRDLRRNDCP